MTPKQTAADIVSAYAVHSFNLGERDKAPALDELRDAIAKAITDQREACAQLIEAMDRTDTAKAFYADFDEAKAIFAAAIRAGHETT